MCLNHSRIGSFLLLSLLLVVPATSAPAQQPDPESPRYKAALVARDFLTGDQLTSEIFANKHLAKSILQDNHAQSVQKLNEIKQAIKGKQLVGFGPEGEYAVSMEFESDDGTPVQVHFKLEDKPPHGFVELRIEGGPSLSGKGTAEPKPDSPRLTWDNLRKRLHDEAEKGFAGSVLIIRDREIVLDEGYGWANEEKQTKNKPETIFAIGSTPIDFTNAGILLLAEQGKLKLDDPITKYFDNVPSDKQSITIEHLRTGRSGLRNFHDIPGDANPDHTWIDRAEAIRRIMDHELLFAPGQGRRHSHSAWGLLAAIIEIVSKQSYQEFTTEHLFEPAGMKHTGFFGQEYPVERIAVGYGMRASSEINSPPHWGQTSWLVMGSGGQVSTTGDMYRWHRALHDGKLLSPESLKIYFRGGYDGVGNGGDMFGFEIIYTQHPDSQVIVTSNNVDSQARRQAFNRIAMDLVRLVQSATDSRKYSLGIQMDINENGVVVEGVVSGSAAERDGLKAGDLLVSANGEPLGDDPLAVLDSPLRKGEKIKFEIERDGKKQVVEVTPNRIGGGD